MNPLERRIAMIESVGGGQPPSLTISFANVNDMQAASDFIRSVYSKLTDERRERAMQSIVAEVLGTAPRTGAEHG